MLRQGAIHYWRGNKIRTYPTKSLTRCLLMFHPHRAAGINISNPAALATWRLGHLDGKPEGLAFTPNGRAIVGLDTRKARHNLVLFEPPIATA